MLKEYITCIAHKHAVVCWNDAIEWNMASRVVSFTCILHSKTMHNMVSLMMIWKNIFLKMVDKWNGRSQREILQLFGGNQKEESVVIREVII